MPEADVQRVARSLTEAGHEVSIVEGDIHLVERLQGLLGPDDLVFNLCYGVQGISRYTHVPGMLEMAGFNYTGSGPVAHVIALEKPITKCLLKTAGIPTPAGFTVAPGGSPTHELGFPLVVKPCRESTSMGMAFVEDDKELDAAIAAVHENFMQPALVECFAPGLDLFVSVLGNASREALPVLQTEAVGEGPPLLTREDKAGRSRPLNVQCPAPIPETLGQRAQRWAIAACDAIGTRDMARVDMRLGPDGDLQVLEVNTLPGMSPSASLPTAAAAAGLGFPELVVRIADEARRRSKRPHVPLGIEATR